MFAPERGLTRRDPTVCLGFLTLSWPFRRPSSSDRVVDADWRLENSQPATPPSARPRKDSPRALSWICLFRPAPAKTQSSLAGLFARLRLAAYASMLLFRGSLFLP